MKSGLSHLLLLLCATASGAFAQHESGIRPKSFREQVGIYHWGGYRARGVASGLRSILELNGSVARIALSPRMAIDYNTGDGCLAGFRLRDAFDDPELRAAVADPRLRVIMITAYDGAGFPDCSQPAFFSPAFHSTQKSHETAEEYSQLVYRLHELYHGSDKEFILSNWEGDNSLYCGQAYAYALDEKFRAACDEGYPRYYGGNPDVKSSIEGIILWLKERSLGVQLGTELARSQGFSGIRVSLAAEISSVHFLYDRGYPNMLRDVVPRASVDYISYSSYESLDTPDPVTSITADLDLIRSVAGPIPIIVGEIGFPRSQYHERQVDVMDAVTEAARSWGVAYIIQWNLYDQDARNDFGVFDLDGNQTPLAEYYCRKFSEGRSRMGVN